MTDHSSAVLASKIYTKKELCLLEPIAQNCGIIIFGASGDLAHRKLFPSLFYLASQAIMPKSFFILGVARTAMTDASFRESIKPSLPKDAKKQEVDAFLARCHYLAGDYGSFETYRELKNTIAELDTKFSIVKRHIFYLSTPPSIYAQVVHELGDAGLIVQSKEGDAWTRVIIEKPFGNSLASAVKLTREIRKVLKERHMYRIDHYLGKETVQNIMMFRFANILFEPVWNRNFIDYVQISAAEQVGVEHRAGYYEQAGVWRDMFQNHLLQLLALISMEPPSRFEANPVRDKRLDIFRSVLTMNASQIQANTICAQYGPGEIGGVKVPGYRQEKNVNPTSNVPTFGAVTFHIDNWRWQGVPFYVRAGKRLAERTVEIAVQFKRVPTSIFKPLLADQLCPNILKFRIQPNEGITMSFETKHPGPKLCMSTVTMDFSYEDTFHTPPPESYARLFQDAMIGDQTLFARSDEVDESWRIIDPIINYWESKNIASIPIYSAGSWGPPNIPGWSLEC